MKTKGETASQRAKLLVTGTLAMFVMGTVNADAATGMAPEDTKPEPPAKGGHGDASDQASRSIQTVHHFDIPAGTLSDVTEALGKAVGVKVSLSSKYAALPSPGVHGVLSTVEAFTAALKGTGMSADFNSADQVTIDLHAAAQDVTVTATSESPSLKYTAPLRDLPMTLTIIPESVMEATASTTLMDALRTVPGITFGAGEGGTPTGDRPFLRGQDAQASTFVDGMRDIGAQTREVFDLESVEVSKGPSSTYAGRGAGGGSLNLNSKMARRENFLAGSFSPGTANFFRGTIDGNTKITDWFSGRLNGMWQNSDIAGRDIANYKRYGVAPSLLFNPTRRSRLFMDYYHLNSHDIPDPGMPYNNPTFFARLDGRARIFQTGDGQPLVVNRNAFYGFRSRDFKNEHVRTVLGRFEYDMGERAVLRNSYRYGKSNQDYVYSQPDDSSGNIYYGLLYRRALARNTAVDTSFNQTDFAGHAKTGSIEHNYAAGLEFSRERSWNAGYTVATPTFTVYSSPTSRTTTTLAANRCPYGAGAAGGYFCTDLFQPTVDDPFTGVTTQISVTNPTSTFTDSIVKTNVPTRQITLTRSLYGFDTVQFLPQLQGTFGIRYDHYDSNYRAALTCVATATVPCSFPLVTGLVNYQAGLAWKPKRAATIYGSVNASATPPGNALTQGADSSALNSTVNQTLPPERTRGQEGGVKWELFGAKALATTAYFQSDTSNVRVAQADGSIASVGSRRVRGLDLSLTGYVSRKWQVFGGYTFMNAVLLNAGFTGGTATTPGVASASNGRRFPNTPEHSFSVTSYYTPFKKLTVGGGVYGAGKVYGNDSPTAPKWVPQYVRVDLLTTYRVNTHLDFQGNIQNLNNELYFLQAYQTHYASLAPGRQGRLTMNVRF